MYLVSRFVAEKIIGYKYLCRNVKVTWCLQAMYLRDEIKNEKYDYVIKKISYSLIAFIFGSIITAAVSKQERLIIFIITIFVAISVYRVMDEKLFEWMEKRNNQMINDYPKIVSQYTILNESGLSTYKAIKRIVDSYDAKRQGKRYAYEELKLTLAKVESKISEPEAYNRFGQRCRMHCYMRLGVLMVQNIKKGNKELSLLLQEEIVNAFEEKKALAIKQAEKAGTKLLIPMIIMLAVVITIIIVPAFISMKI